MKNLRNTIDNWLYKLDKDWEAIPLERQHKYLLYFFTAYTLLTTGVIFKVCFDTAGADHNLEIGHIENPPLKEKKSPAYGQDTLSTMLKTKIYERK